MQFKSPIEKQVGRRIHMQMFRELKQHSVWSEVMHGVIPGQTVHELRGLDDNGQGELRVWSQIGRDQEQSIRRKLQQDLKELTA